MSALWALRVGDRVRVDDDASWCRGMKGRVISVDPGRTYPVEIRLRRTLRQVLRRSRKTADFKAWELVAR